MNRGSSQSQDSSPSNTQQQSDDPFTVNSGVPTINIGNIVPLKLDRHNYILWKSLFLPILAKYKLLDLVNGVESCPSPTLLNSSIPNPAYVSWTKRDQIALNWFNTTISEELLPYFVGINSSSDLWLILEDGFSNVSSSNVIQLKSKLQCLKKCKLTINNYFNQIKQLVDSLAAAGSPISDKDVVVYALNGLPDDYGPFTISIHNRSDPVTTDELHNLLLSEELAIDFKGKALLNTCSESTTQPFHTILYSHDFTSGSSSKTSYYSGRNRGRNRRRTDHTLSNHHHHPDATCLDTERGGSGTLQSAVHLTGGTDIRGILNWLDLPTEVTSLIFRKVGLVDVFLACQFVCSMWRTISKETHIGMSLDFSNFDHGCLKQRRDEVSPMVLIQRCFDSIANGKLVELSFDDSVLISNDLLFKNSNLRRFTSLKVLQLSCTGDITTDALVVLVHSAPLLEDLRLCRCFVSDVLLNVVGKSCPELKVFRVICAENNALKQGDPEFAASVAKYLTKIETLVVRGILLSKDEINLILKDCRALVTIDLGENHRIRRGQRLNEMVDNYLIEQAAELVAVEEEEDEVEEEEEDGWMEDYEFGSYLPRDMGPFHR